MLKYKKKCSALLTLPQTGRKNAFKGKPTLMSDETMTTEKNALFNRLGFTLVELMITLAILAIAAALVSPAIMQMGPEMRLRNNASNLHADLLRAKSSAVKNNTSITVRFTTPGMYYTDTNGNGNFDGAFCGSPSPAEPCVLLGEDLNRNGIKDAGENDLNNNARFDENSGIGFGTGAAANDWRGQGMVQLQAVTFNSRGLVTLTSPAPPAPPSLPSVYLQNRNGDICYSIEVHLAGSVQLRKYNGTIWN